MNAAYNDSMKSVRTDTDYAALIEAMPQGAVLTLDHVDWNEYEDLLRQFDERPAIRLTYDQGRLEIMTLSPEHERAAGLFPALILVLAEECGLNYLSYKSTTLRKRGKSRGAEADDCFYFRDFKRISGKKTLDLSVDPPPDLAFEIDISSGSIPKFPIYAAVGVPEIWRYDSKQMEFYRLVRDEYTKIASSNLFPFLTPDTILKFLRQGEAEGTVVMAKAFRKWVATHRAKTGRPKRYPLNQPAR